MTKQMILCVLYVSISLCSCIEDSNASGARITLGPTDVFREAVTDAAIPLAFHQTVPFSRGELVWEGGHDVIAKEGELLGAHLEPINYWPDGSVRLLWVQGMWKGPINNAHTLHLLKRSAAVSSPAARVSTIADSPNTIELLCEGLGAMKISIDAGLVPLTRDKEIKKTNHPDYWDYEGQYHWAQQVSKVSPGASRIDLKPQVRDVFIELDTPVYTVHVVRGLALAQGHDGDLEWQLRVFAFKNSPLVRFEMTWKVFWDTEAFGLTDATMTINLDQRIVRAHVPALESKVPNLSDNARLITAPDARWQLHRENSLVHSEEGPCASAEGWLFKTSRGWLGMATPDFSLKGPGSIDVRPTGIAISTWSPHSNMVLDLRRCVTIDEPGMGEADFGPDINARGMSFTTHVSLVMGQDAPAVAKAVEVEKSMEWLWYSTRDEYVSTGAIGPWRQHALDNNRAIFDALLANVKFVARSQSKWRWTGLVNFGDVRTDYARGNKPADGFYAGRWLHSGRYGWRHGSGEPYAGYTIAGLFMNDRESLTLARRYAHHVANVDTRQSRFWGKSLALSGGMHRRNMDHWSGNIQTQYTPSWGVYLQYWMTGDARMGDALEDIRQFSATNHPGSIYAASAWFNHYAQTHNTKSLEMAQNLYQRCVGSWTSTAASKFPEEAPQGPSALYYKNFRRTLDLYRVLIEAHKATGDDNYLEALYENRRTHEPLGMRYYTGTWDNFIAPAYLLANGYTPQQLGEDSIRELQEMFPKYIPVEEFPEYGHDDYETVRHIISEMIPPIGNSTYRRSLWIGWRAANSPLVFSWIEPVTAPQDAE